jgi:hypothetical protein
MFKTSNHVEKCKFMFEICQNICLDLLWYYECDKSSIYDKKPLIHKLSMYGAECVGGGALHAGSADVTCMVGGKKRGCANVARACGSYFTKTHRYFKFFYNSATFPLFLACSV